MDGIAVVTADRYRSLLPVRSLLKLISEDPDHEGLHHAAAIAEDITAKGVDNLLPTCPTNRTMNGGFTHSVAAVISYM